MPYIAPWERERQQHPELVLRRGHSGVEGIAYRDEQPVIDRRGEVLWARWGLARGKGRANLAGVHPLRQRHCMDRMLCQSCGHSTLGTRPDERHLFVMRGEAPIAEGEQTLSPPIHLDCAEEAVRDCPHLRKGWVAALVGHPTPWGVAGTLYDRSLTALPHRDDDNLTLVRYDDPDIPWVLARRDVIQLNDVTPIDLAQLAAETGSPARCHSAAARR